MYWIWVFYFFYSLTQFNVWLVFFYPWPSAINDSSLFIHQLRETSLPENTPELTGETDLEQLQCDLCDGSTKFQVPTFSVSSSSQVPLVAAEYLRLEGENKKNY